MTQPILSKEDDLVSRLEDHGLFSKEERIALFAEARAEIIRLRAAQDCCYGVRPLSDCQCEKDRLAALAATPAVRGAQRAWNSGGNVAWQTVPLPATPEMIAAAERTDIEMRAQGFANAEPEAIYYAMLDAAPALEPGWLQKSLDAAAERASHMPDWMTRTATPAVGGGLEALADHIEYEQARGIDIPMSDGEAAQIVAMLRAVPPASPLRGREILLALAKRHAEAIGELGEAQADKRSIDALSRNWLGGRVNGLAIALEVARVVVSESPPEQPAANPATGRGAAIKECIELIEKRFLVGWTITQNGLAREDEANDILEALRELLSPTAPDKDRDHAS